MRKDIYRQGADAYIQICPTQLTAGNARRERANFLIEFWRNCWRQENTNNGKGIEDMEAHIAALLVEDLRIHKVPVKNIPTQLRRLARHAHRKIK